MPAGSKPDTGSLNAIDTSNAPATGATAAVVTSTVGAAVSARTTQSADAAFSLPAASTAASATTTTRTSPSKPGDGVIVAVYSAPLPARSPASPFATERPARSKPDTGSLNAIDTSNAPATRSSLVLVTNTVGATMSTPIVNRGEATFQFFSWLWAAPANTCTETSPSIAANGVIVAV